MTVSAEPGTQVPRYALAASICLVLLGAVSHMTATAILDDAYMFARYADNLISHHGVAWNPAGQATYGITSLLYLALVIPFRLLVPESPALALALASASCGVAFLLLFGWLVRMGVAGFRQSSIPWLVTFGSLALAVESFAGHFGTGMDTAFACAYLTGFILLSMWHSRVCSHFSTVAAGVFGSLAFAARPDLLLFTIGLPLAQALLVSDRQRRQRAFVILLVAVAGVGIQVAGAAYYFDSPLPLSFFAKGTRLYGDFLHSQYRLVGIDQLLSFLSAYWYLWVLIGTDLALQVRDRRPLDATEVGLLVSLLLFVGYYTFFVTQIMSYKQRFYHPALPALLFLAARSAHRHVGRLPVEFRRAFSGGFGDGGGVVMRWIGIAVITGVLLPSAVSVARGFASRQSRGELFEFGLVDNYKRRGRAYWYRLDAVSALPDDAVIATTEVGLVAAMNPQKRIVDLTGLNETRLAHDGFSADYLFTEYSPDFIYMPHPHYDRISKALREHQRFQEYELYPATELGTEMGVAYWRGSGHRQSMKDLLSAP